jgi:catechol 2,3-dioxygenase-like lactoylglutathione lyase family enzyme
MITHFDHVTLVVREVEPAKDFFALLGFAEVKSVLISGEQFCRYMGVDGIEAEHITLALTDSVPRLEVQLLKYHHPDPIPNPQLRDLTQLGFNHICFAVNDLAAVLEKLSSHGIQPRNEVMKFHDRKLVFLTGPEGITVELAEWD